jgi:hypothetical protein
MTTTTTACRLDGLDPAAMVGGDHLMHHGL